MKGIVFTELLKMVEQSHGHDMVDTIIEKSDLESGGAYTTVGTYNHTEAEALVSNLSNETGVAIPDLLKAFGEHLFVSLAAAYPQFIRDVGGVLDFLEQVETYIHVEVRKLYPDAELPSFECSRPNSPNELHMAYESGRHLEDLCEGLLWGAIKYFKEQAEVERTPLEDGRELFVITLV